MEPILEVRNLSVSYFSHMGVASSAITDVSFDVRPGEILGMLGESGSGKSTLAASLLLLLPANGKIQQGSTLFEGRPLLQAALRPLESIRGNRIALINQEPLAALHPTMRIGDQVGEVLAAPEYLSKRARRQRIQTALSAVLPAETEKISFSYPHQLSGGQRQCVLIAQAIACGPSLVVADEPTASLDPTTQRDVLSVFQTLRQKFGLAIILITHNPSLLVGLADRVLILYAGRVAEIGPTESVLSTPMHPYTRDLLRCLPPLPRSADEVNRKTMLPVISGDAPNSALLPQGCRFEPRCPDRFEACGKREPAACSPNEGHTVCGFTFGGWS